MAVTYFSAASGNGNVLSAMPTHAINDTLVMFAFNGNGVSTPTVPSGWIERISTNGTNRSGIFAWRIANSSSVASGTWTNATQLACAVYRSDANFYLLPGHANIINGAASTIINYPALDALFRFSKVPSSWVVGASGTETDTTANTAPTGMTNRTSSVATSEIALHDTNGALAWGSTNVSCTSTRYAGATCEIYETPIAISTGGAASSILAYGMFS